MKNDLNQMIIFTKAVELGSFVAAATLLGIPKTTVSRKIAELENRLGVKLLHRNARRLDLTTEGAIYYEHCARITTEVEEADSSVSDIQKKPSGILRVSIPDQLGPLILQEILNPFLQRYPDIGIEAIHPIPVNKMAEQGVDIAIHLGDLPDSNIHALSLGVISYHLYASEKYLSLYGAPEHPEQLMNHRCIELLDKKNDSSWLLNKNEQKFTHHFHSRYSVESESLGRELALAGIGICKLSNILTFRDVKSKRLIPVLSDWHLNTLAVYLVYPSRKYLPVRTRAMLDHIKSLQEKYSNVNVLTKPQSML